MPSAPLQSPPRRVSRLDDIRDVASPAFKPRYSQRPPTSPSGNLADLAKRNLLDDFDSRSGGLDDETKRKIRKLGEPFHLDPPSGPTDGSDPDSLRELRFLKPAVAAPFFAAVLVERDMRVSFPEEAKSKDDKMGLAGNRLNKSQPTPRPLIPLVPYFEEYCEDLVNKNQPGPQRINWVRQTFKAPKDHEEKFFTPPLVPSEAWSNMLSDQGSWTHPEKSAPAGVEGGSGAATAPKARKVPPWNKGRDTELSGLESLARDGMRLANASLLTFSHLMNGLLGDHARMEKDNLLRTMYTLKDLQYCTGEHFCRLSSQLAHLRRLNALEALNLANPAPFKECKFGPDLFGGKFKELHAADVAARKQRVEEDKLRKAQGKSSVPRDKKKQSFRGNDGGASTSRGQSHQAPAKQKSGDDNRKDSSGKDSKGGGGKHGSGGGGRGGNRGGGGGRGGKRGGGGGGGFKGRSGRRH